MTDRDLEQWMAAITNDVSTVTCLPGNRLAQYQTDLEQMQDEIASALQKIERVKERAERMAA